MTIPKHPSDSVNGKDIKRVVDPYRILYEPNRLLTQNAGDSANEQGFNRINES